MLTLLVLSDLLIISFMDNFIKMKRERDCTVEHIKQSVACADKRSGGSCTHKECCCTKRSLI